MHKAAAPSLSHYALAAPGLGLHLSRLALLGHWPLFIDLQNSCCFPEVLPRQSLCPLAPLPTHTFSQNNLSSSHALIQALLHITDIITSFFKMPTHSWTCIGFSHYLLISDYQFTCHPSPIIPPVSLMFLELSRPTNVWWTNEWLNRWTPEVGFTGSEVIFFSYVLSISWKG